MNHASSNSEPKAAPAGRPKLLTIREEARNAVLLEQLSFLLEHGRSCPDGCSECARLRNVEDILLQPFQVDVYLPPAA